MLSKLNKNLFEKLAKENLYEDCWLTEMPKTYSKPNKQDYEWLWSFVSHQNYLKNLPEKELQLLKDKVVLIESTVPIISSNGKIVSVYHRLYAAYQMAKSLIHQNLPLDVISSVVIYKNGKLIKNKDTTGIMLSKGRNSLIDSVFYCKIIAESLLNVIRNSGVYYRLEKLLENYIDNLNDLEAYIVKSPSGESIIRSVQKTKLVADNLFKEFRSTLGAHHTELKELSQIEQKSQKSLNEAINAIDAIHEKSKVSIHVSWLNVIIAERTNTDIITHEMAHVIDFYNGGCNGVPQQSRKYQEVWNTFFYTEKEKHKNSLSVLRSYAFKNKYEFLAVCAETFFTNPLILKTNIPEIYESLKLLYGYEPKPNYKMKSLKLFKTVLFSKISTSKLT